MVDVTFKQKGYREAVAKGVIKLGKQTIILITGQHVEKGSVLDTAKVAAILAAKETSRIIPLCHNLPLTNVKVDFDIVSECKLGVTVVVKAETQTGVEMEALTAVSAALLTVWDMVKQYEKDDEGQYPSTSIENIHVMKKTVSKK